MSPALYSAAQVAVLVGVLAGFAGSALLRLRIGLFLQGDRSASLSRLVATSNTSLRQSAERQAEIRAHRARAFAPGSDVDPALRRLFVLERRLRRLAWACAAALVASTAFVPPSTG